MGQNESSVSRSGSRPIQRTRSSASSSSGPQPAQPAATPRTPSTGNTSRSIPRAPTVQNPPIVPNSVHVARVQSQTAPRPPSIVSVAASAISVAPPPYSALDEQQYIPETETRTVREIPVEPAVGTTPARRVSSRQGSDIQTSPRPHRLTSSHSTTHHDRELPPTPEDTPAAPLPPSHSHSSMVSSPIGSRYTHFHVEIPSHDTASTLSRSSSRPLPGAPRRRGSSASSVVEDPLVVLRKYDTIILIDDSVSMGGELWSEARAALAEIAVMAGHYDVDGVDIYFVNDRAEGTNLRAAEEVEALFDSVDPNGADSELGGRLEEFLLDYLDRAERYKAACENGTAHHMTKVKPVNYIIITDGEPSDDPESVIVSAARRLDAKNFPLSQVGIQFVQIGDDTQATAALKHLDDGLAKAHGIRDIVDMTHLPDGRLDAQILPKILLGGINRRIDKIVT